MATSSGWRLLAVCGVMASIVVPTTAMAQTPELGWSYSAQLTAVWAGGNSESSTFGLGSTLLWIRYVGIPVAQWATEGEDVASPRAGGVIGLAGSLIVLAAGCRLAASRPA